MLNLFGHNFTSSDDPNWVSEPDRRGTFNILSTCLVTLGLCVWTAIHLNVPEHKEGKTKQLLRKAGWMLMGLLSPEAIAYTAYQQYNQARAISQAMNSGNSRSEYAGHHRRTRGRRPWDFVTSFYRSSESIEYEAVGVPTWTIVHGFLAVMGGFAVEINGDFGNPYQRRLKNFLPKKVTGAPRTRLTLTPAALRYLKNNGLEYLIPVLPRDSIEDKSKGSTFAKALVCFQASWFCIGCLNRFAQGLPISLLELNTLGHALCTLFIYFMWWNKPLDVGEPERISLDASLTGEELVEVSKLLAAMCVKSKLDALTSESQHFQEHIEAFVFNVEYTCLKETRTFGGRIDTMNIADALENLERFRQLPKQRPWYLHGLISRPMMFQYAPSKKKLAQKIDCLLAVQKAGNLMEATRTTPDADTERIDSNSQRSDAWGNVQLSVSEANPGWVETAFNVYEKVPDSFEHEYLDPLRPMRQFAHRNPPLVPLVRRPFIDVRHSDMRRWQLAMAYPEFARLPSNLLTDRIRNIPRFEDYEKYTSLYLGFGLVSLIYGGLHCLAWDAPFTSPVEATLWRLSSVAVATSGVFVLFVSTWQSFPPFWRRINRSTISYAWSYLDEKFVTPFINNDWVEWLLLWPLADKLEEKLDLKVYHMMTLTWPGRVQQALEFYNMLALQLLSLFVAFSLLLLMFSFKMAFDILTVGFIPLYFLARMYLVVVSFINLAHLPESAYSLPSWSSYVPHIG